MAVIDGGVAIKGHPRGEDGPDFPVEELFREYIAADGCAELTAGLGRPVVEVGFHTPEPQIIGCSQSGRPGADDGHPFSF